MEFKRLFGAALLFAIAAGASATRSHAADAVRAENAWARATAPGQAAAAAYFDLTSSAAAVLVAASSPAAEKAELHTMSMEGGVMRMRPVDKVDLPAAKTVRFARGGLHVMLIGLKNPLKAGGRVPLALTIRAADGARSTINVEADVRAPGAMGPGHGGH